jgi:hypothetical protein
VYNITWMCRIVIIYVYMAVARRFEVMHSCTREYSSPVDGEIIIITCYEIIVIYNNDDIFFFSSAADVLRFQHVSCKYPVVFYTHTHTYCYYILYHTEKQTCSFLMCSTPMYTCTEFLVVLDFILIIHIERFLYFFNNVKTFVFLFD